MSSLAMHQSGKKNSFKKKNFVTNDIYITQGICTTNKTFK